MDDDIVAALRYAARTCNHGFPNGAGDSFPDPTCCGGCLRLAAAADEIERLRALGDALASAALTARCQHFGNDRRLGEARRAWWDGRHGQREGTE